MNGHRKLFRVGGSIFEKNPNIIQLSDPVFLGSDIRGFLRILHPLLPSLFNYT